VNQREDLQIQKENTGKENRMLNWVRAGYGLTRIILRSLSALSMRMHNGDDLKRGSLKNTEAQNWYLKDHILERTQPKKKI
jgi:hypothetical protein